MELEVDVEGVDRTLKEIERDLHRGMEKSMDNLVDNAKGRARRVIAETDSIFNAEVYKGFKDTETKNSSTKIRAKVYNNVGHADALEHGATYGSKGPPVAALLPWVARKMHWSPDFDIDGSYDDPDGGSTPDAIDEENPDEDDEANWDSFPTNYNEAFGTPSGTIVNSKYSNDPILYINETDGVVLGWNKSTTQLKPIGSGFEVYKRIDGEWQYVENIDSAKYYDVSDDPNILGYKPGTGSGFTYDFYRTRDLPDGLTADFDEGNWDSVLDWDASNIKNVSYRTSDGLVQDGEVIEITDSDVTFYNGNFGVDYIKNGTRNSDVELIGIERDEDNGLTSLAKLGITGKVDVDLDDVFGEDDYYLRNREGVYKNYLAEFETHAPYIFEGIEKWKSGGSKDLRNTTYYSTVVKEGLNVNADIRGDSRSIQIDENEKRMIKSLNELSKNFIKRHYDDDDDGRVRMYRTLRNESPKLSKEIWDNPSQDEWEIPTNVVNNYTTTQSNLQGFDRSLLHKPEVDVDRKVLLAIDGLIHSDWDREGEVHIRGDLNDTFSAEDLEFQSETYSDSVDFLTDQFFERGSFTSFQDEQMVAIASTIREMGQSRTALSTDDGKNRVDNFIEEFLERGLESNTNYSADEWKDWRGTVTGRGEVLEFDGRTRAYSTDWNTYDPTEVDTVPLEDTYDTQRVEILDINTEQILDAKILSRNQSQDKYVLDTEQGKKIEIYKPGMAQYDDYKIIAGKKWDSLDETEKQSLIEDKVDRVNFENFSSSNFEDAIRDHHKTAVPEGFKDKKMYYDIMHGAKVEYFQHQTNVGSHKQFSDGSRRLKYTSNANRSTTIHETTHGIHSIKGFNVDHYPDSDLKQQLYKNLFDENGDNITDKSHRIEDVLLTNGLDDPLGLPDNKSIPDVIQKRVENPAPYEYEPVNDATEFLHPIDGDFQIGDRIKLETPGSAGTTTGQLQSLSKEDYDLEGIEYEGEITSYEILLIDEDATQTVDIWVDDNGEYVNMRGIQIHEKANQPDESVDKSIPDIELEEEGFDKVIEATNLAFMEMVWNGSAMHLDGKEVRDDGMNFVGRAYSTRAANETLTVASQILRSKNPYNPTRSYIGEKDVISLHERYPYLIEAWLENFNPSPQVAEILIDLGYDL